MCRGWMSARSRWVGSINLMKDPRTSASKESNMDSQTNAAVHDSAHQVDEVEVTVEYLPATSPFHRPYPQSTTIEVVRTDAMVFFGVRDHQDRDTHRFFLEFDRLRLTYNGQTLEQ